MVMQRDGMIEMLRDGDDMKLHYMRMRPIRDADKIVYRGGEWIVRINEAEGFGVELLAIDAAADRDG